MKVLLVHNRYLLPGGEEAVFNTEYAMLVNNGLQVRKVEFSNDALVRSWHKWITLAFSIFNPKSFMRIICEIRSFHPDLIHFHNIFSIATPAAIWAAWICKIPIVMTLHNFRLLCPSGTLLYKDTIYETNLTTHFPWNAVWHRVYRNSRLATFALSISTTLHRIIGTWRIVNRFIVLTEFSKSKFINSQLRIHPDTFAVKPNFAPNSGHSLIKCNDFLFVGRLSPEKGVSILLNAFIDSPHQLVIIGDGPLRSDVDLAISQHHNIRYLGPQPQIEVLRYMRNSLALVFPSIWYEGMPMVILESFSSGTPVIASRLGAMAEIIEHEYNGLHFDPGSSASLRYALDHFSATHAGKQRLNINALETWNRLYTSDRNFQILLSIYHDALGKRSTQNI